MEFGPRALGARSIIGDPRNPDMQSTMNLKIKFRESFRPFAPAVLAPRRHRLLRPAAGEPVHARGLAGRGGPAARRRQRRRERTRPAEGAPLDHPRRHPRRPLGPGADGHRAQQPRLSPAADRLSGARTGCPVLVNTSLQRARRAHREHPARRLHLLHAHQHRHARARQLPAGEERPARLVGGARLARRDPARLTTAAPDAL
ncbi:hypothetical protein LT493_20630 [Streptomyces tricolor]|nr:hypothetical protein [Streptomyces tricolor]